MPDVSWRWGDRANDATMHEPRLEPVVRGFAVSSRVAGGVGPLSSSALQDVNGLCTPDSPSMRSSRTADGRLVGQ